MKRFDLYHEKNRINGCVAVEYTAIARDEAQVQELARVAGYGIEGYEIEYIGILPRGCNDTPRINNEWE